MVNSIIWKTNLNTIYLKSSQLGKESVEIIHHWYCLYIEVSQLLALKNSNNRIINVLMVLDR